MIRFEHITLQFNNKFIFSDFNLEIETGEKVLLRAPSGKGKSSLVKLLLGFLKPDAGEIFLDNEKLSKDTIKYFRKNIAYVSQDVELQNSNVLELINGIFTYKNNKHILLNNDVILETMQYFGLNADVLNKNVSNLSGGQRQRLGLVICILLDRDIWVLDEVTSGLDNELKEKVVSYIMELDKTIIIISHDDLWLTTDVKVEVW